MSIILNDFIFIYYENFRSRAYAQVLSEQGLLPKKIIKLGNEFQPDFFSKYPKVLLPYCSTEFNPKVSVASSFGKYGLVEEEVLVNDVNSIKFINLLKKVDPKYVIYSGRAGVIVSEEFLAACEGVLHVHGGYLPFYRGSTTFYYSILDNFEIGASAIFLNSKIDQGKIIHKQKFTPCNGVNVDYIQDPMVRATVLIGAIKNIINNNPLGVLEDQDTTEGFTYRVIHPVLKKMALDKIEL